MLKFNDKLLFVEVPRTGTTTIRDCISWYEIMNGFRHASIKDYLQLNPQDIGLDVVSIVRNPYDRFFSGCHQIRRDEKENRNLSVSEVIAQEILPNEGNYLNDVFIPQHHYVSIGGKVLVDKILRYENLEKEWRGFVDEFNKTAQFPITKFLPRSNASAEKIPWEEEIKVLTQDELDLINNMYTRDFKMFGYEKKQKV